MGILMAKKPKNRDVIVGKARLPYIDGAWVNIDGTRITDILIAKHYASKINDLYQYNYLRLKRAKK